MKEKANKKIEGKARHSGCKVKRIKLGQKKAKSRITIVRNKIFSEL